MDDSESISDIVVEMREHAWKFTKDKNIMSMLESYADRIEDAANALWDKAYSEGFDDRSCN